MQNASITAFPGLELLRENQQGGGAAITPAPPPHAHTHFQIRVKKPHQSLHQKFSIFHIFLDINLKLPQHWKYYHPQ